MFNFLEWLREEYAKYGPTADTIYKFYQGLEDKQKPHFIAHIREHHNHAFESGIEWMAEIDARVAAGGITDNALEVLNQIVESPKFDGDVVSKNGLGELRELGLVVRIANNNTFGDNAATYKGFRVHTIHKNK